MRPPSVERTGTLMVRLWAEPGHATSVRARITQTLDADADPRVAVAGSADAICAIVRTWVEEVAGPPDQDVVDARSLTTGDAAVTPAGDAARGRMEAHMGGNTKKAKGRAKQAAGAITGDKKLQREGKRDERLGNLENKTDDATDAVHDKVDEVIEKLSDKK